MSTTIRFCFRRRIAGSSWLAIAYLGACLPLPAVSLRAQTLPASPSYAAIQPPSTVWQPVGPSQVSTASWNLVTGPVLSLAADPADPSGNTLYVGTGGGGVWKSANAAGTAASVSFAPLTDNLSVWPSAPLTSLSIGAVTLQPGGTGVVLAGTGDPNSGYGSWYGAGILRSTDGGATWSLITATNFSKAGLRYNFLGSAFAGFAWSTTTPNLVVAAVAEPGNPSTVVAALDQQNTVGLYYSQDAGATWYFATIEDGTQVIQGDQYFSGHGNSATAVLWNPVRQRFYAAVRYHGYYESQDGITWTRLTNQPGANLTLRMCPTNPGSPASRACPIFRGALAVQPATGDLFALTVDTSNLDQGLWQDACHLMSGACASPTVKFATNIDDKSLQSPVGSGTFAQADSDLWISAVPAQQDTLLFIGAQDIWKCSLANSCVWRNTTNTQTCAAAQVAPAQHAVESTFASTGLLWFGNDAGLWRTTDSVNQQKTVCSSDDASHFQNLNAGLGSIAEVKSIAEDPGNPSTWLAALGPLGTASAGSDLTSPWSQVLDGEGDVVAIDPADPQNWYATSASGIAINRCTSGSSCDIAGFGKIAIGEPQVNDDFQPVAAPWILDPQNPSDVILGTCRMWRGPATGSGWTQQNQLSSMLDKVQGSSCDGNAEIGSIAAAPITSGATAGNAAEQLYVGMAGVLDGGGLIPGHLFTATVNNASQSSNTTWLDRYSSPVTNKDTGKQFNLSGYTISSIDADAHDPTGQTVYVTLQGISASAAHLPVLFSSTDAGAHWTNITANLPASPANATLVDPNNANIVYIATDAGVYVTQKVADCSLPGNPCWTVYGSGLPTSPVVGLTAYNEGATQTLRAATHGRGIWQVDLATAGIAPTAAALQPTSLTFSPQQEQTKSAAQILTLTNTGHLNLNVTSLSITGDFVETDNCATQSLALQGTCTMSISFSPSQQGAETGLLTIFGNLAGGQLTVPLSGTGLAPASVVLTPSSLSFSGATVGSKSSPQFVTVANTGDVAAILTKEIVSGDFSIAANTCTSSLASNYSCTLGIVFSPTASGSRSGVLTVVDSVGTQTATLSGSGQNPANDALAPASLAFGPQQVGTVSAPQLLTLNNTGDQPLTGISVTTTGDFTAVNNCASTLPGQATCTLSVTYVPTVAGAESGTVTVTDALRTQTVALTGTGLAPPGASALPASIDFGGYAVGSTSSTQTVTVTNSGGYDVAGLVAVVTSGFTLASNNCAATLAVGTNCQIGITFTPAAAGPVTGTLTLSATNLPKPLVIRLSGSGDDFGMTISGSSTAIITSGQTATFPLQLQDLSGTSGTVALACTGAPQNATCSLNPVSIALTGANTSSVTATIATGVSTSALMRPIQNWTIVPALSLALPLGFVAWRRRGRMLAMLFVLMATASLVLSGCGVGSSSGSGGKGGGGGSGGGTSSQTPPGTYTLTVTGTMSNITHKVQMTLTVQ